MNKKGYDIIREAIIQCELYEYCTRKEYYNILMMARKMLVEEEE